MHSTPGPIGVLLGSTVDPESVGENLATDSVTVESRDGTAAQIAVFRLGDQCVLIPRHGIGSTMPAHLVDHHANLRAMASMGCRRVVGLCSTGSLRPDLRVGAVVVPDDVFALGVHPTLPDGKAGHVVPSIDAEWRGELLAAWDAASPAGEARPVDGGVYAQTTGPRFETPSEVRFLAANADLVGMTMASELFLAVELGIRYAAVCSIDNPANGLAGVTLDPVELRHRADGNAERMARTLSRVIAILTGVNR